MIVLTLIALVVAAGCAGLAFRMAGRERRRSEARVAALAAALDGPADPRPAGASATHQLFDTSIEAPDVRPMRLAIGLGAGVLVLAMALVTSIARDAGRDAPPPSAPLELLSMTHEREGAALTVTGVVRGAGPFHEGPLEAEVQALNRNGGVAAHGGVPLVPAGGDEMQFRITIPEAPDATRYRVGFRTGAGVVRHVDRREAAPAATAARR
jgi:hypothetical protein